MRETTLADIKVIGKGGEGSAPGAAADMPQQPMVQAIVRLAVPLKPMESHDTADIHLQSVEDPTLKKVNAQRRL